MRLRSKVALFPLIASLALLVGVLPAHAGAHVRVVVEFDASAGELPEGVAVDKRGNVYVSLVAPVSEIRKITPSGQQSVLADLGFGGFGPLGLAVDARGRVYAAAATFDPATHGVWRIAHDGTATRLPGTAAIGFPNGIAFDERGNLYATDSSGGAVWRIPRGGSAEPWAESPLLEGTGAFGLGFPVGANGISYGKRSMIVSNTEQGTLVRIPIRPKGNAGPPALMLDHPALFGSDGTAIDAHGAVYVAVIAQSTIVRVRGGTVTTIADADHGINQASSIAFGTGKGNRKSLFAVNFGVFSPAPTPSLLEIRVGVPGDPLP